MPILWLTIFYFLQGSDVIYFVTKQKYSVQTLLRIPVKCQKKVGGVNSAGWRNLFLGLLRYIKSD